MAPAPTIARRRRPPLHWKLGVSVRKRWHRLRKLWRPERALEDVPYFGATFRVEPRDVIGNELILKRFEWLQIPAMLAACRELKPAAFIDIGANFGLYTCIIGRQKFAERLIAFEPNEAVIGRLTDHIVRNGVTGVEIHETAVGATHHKAALQLGAPGFDALTSVVETPGQNSGGEIDVVTLDETLSFKSQPLIFKIDVEGYELEVLKGGENLFAQNYGYAQIESFEDERAATVISTMARFGWRWADHIVDDFIFRRDKI
ncbi:MAG TPA: FkbM family methyltransferase [Xanthobacteraceae bacterium]|jgi:FkbM family methyltransferase|nr:FkbM family methyltransferase [Xanthobacteraceae bacterium]